MSQIISKEECEYIAKWIDQLEDDSELQNIPNAIAREAFLGKNISCDTNLRLCVYVSCKKSKTRVARFDIHPSNRQCCDSCKAHTLDEKNMRIFCEGGDLCNQPLKTLELILQRCKLPTYVPINIIPYPFEKENTILHLDSNSIWDDDVLEEDAHANGLFIDEKSAYVIDCNKNMTHRSALNKLFSEVLQPYFNKKGKSFEPYKKDFLAFSYHDLCRYAIPYMILTPWKYRRKRDFMEWSKEIAIRVCGTHVNRKTYVS